MKTPAAVPPRAFVFRSDPAPSQRSRSASAPRGVTERTRHAPFPRTPSVSAANRGSSSSGTNAWIVPANPSFYDIDAALSGGPGTEITWKQGRGICVGDTAYMYLASPVSAVCYKCEVTETGIPFSYADENVRIDRLMKIRLLQVYPRNAFPYAFLRENGVKLIRGPVPVPEALLEKLNAFPEQNG